MSNIDAKFQDRPCELEMEISLVYPYSVSLETLLDMIRIWDMRLISASSLSPNAKIAIKYLKFSKLFGKEKIVIGNEYKLKGTEKFILKIKLVNVSGNVNENKNRNK